MHKKSNNNKAFDKSNTGSQAIKNKKKKEREQKNSKKCNSNSFFFRFFFCFVDGFWCKKKKINERESKKETDG